ncbi:PQQ-like beta-propeller repeat protein [Planctomyces sp. SH-PL14]|uniref:PQQ-like beta-propeller repeat protein n=1 Tax=Planctomyces sp. SH-PL14 TaxID=1632864 RepID=UPI00078C655E|nr:PQQ-like beta-propeller repeat protein [Planctomyces sp. SH-PL14]AMV17871.1 outer membrane biogenesis protein BamB [Planctomyces sp. SH-PL14]
MSRLAPGIFAAALVCSLAMAVAEDVPLEIDARIAVPSTDWPWWRGPQRNGIATPGQPVPLQWTETKNIVWKAPLPGRGHGSPIVSGNQVLLQTAETDPQVQSVVCLDRGTGKLLWQTPVHHGGVEIKQNEKSTYANSTPACDGERIFVNFLNAGGIYTTALDRSGKQIWQVKVTDYVLHQGFSSSPALYRSLVIVSADNKGTGALAALNRDTGETVWKRDRPALPNYTSPIILKVHGRDQLLFVGCDLVTSLDPLTGETLWETAGATTECVTSTVTDGNVIFTSGGYPKNHLAAIRADGSGERAWENGSRVYVPSMVLSDGHLYAMLDAGIAQCWEASTGKERWKARVGGTFSSSLVLADGNVFATDEAGKTTVFKADPRTFERVGENQLGNSVFATPAICDGRIYQRVITGQDKELKESLYCIGQ